MGLLRDQTVLHLAGTRLPGDAGEGKRRVSHIYGQIVTRNKKTLAFTAP